MNIKNTSDEYMTKLVTMETKYDKFDIQNFT